jgi:hypothetical protein
MIKTAASAYVLLAYSRGLISSRIIEPACYEKCS